MSARIDPNLLIDLKRYGEEGAVNIEACFNCGNCTAICPLTSDDHPFPRNTIRLMQLGLKDQLLQTSDPWLCYYCGECTETCPRGAEPAEAQMALRRWLTAQYDWTGLARKFYTSEQWSMGAIYFTSLLIVLAFALFHGPIVTERVELNTFAPLHIVHTGDWIMAGILAFFLVTNGLRMHYFILLRGAKMKIPLMAYLSELWHLPYQAVTQKRWATCDDRPSWLSHLFLVSGYGLMLIIIIFFLPWFQTDNIYPIYHPQRWLGYYATIVLLYGVGRAIHGRLQKEREMHRFSHPSDWMFLVLLFSVTVSGILVHIFRYAGLPLATYYTYVAHVAMLVPMLVLEVPFGKWSHLAYRPLAIYFEAVKVKAREMEEAELAPAAV